MQERSKVAIVYLLWSDEPYKYLDDAIAGVIGQSYPKELTEFIIVYNPKAGEKSACSFIRDKIDENKEQLPHTTILEQETNLGFSGGNNKGMKWAVESGFDYVFLHNGDGYMGNHCLRELVKVMNEDQKIGIAQSLVMLDPEKERINSAGNSFHYLGFGFCDLYKKKRGKIDLPSKKDIGYASGAATIMRTSFLTRYGYWDEDYFMYHEDTEYSLRIRVLGYRVVLATSSIFFHKYSFSKSMSKYFWLERNRYAILISFYKLKTLLLLAPINAVCEIALLFFAFRGGWLGQRFDMYIYWLKPRSWKLWLKKRKRIMKIRKIGDRELLDTAVSEIHFQEDSVANPVLDKIGNPVMRWYWKLVKRII